MVDQELIKDTGLFLGQKILEFSLTESLESITNLYQTIKEYREFTDPAKDSWFDYIYQIFNIFGFNTVKVAPRLISLQEMGENHKSKALVCIIKPSEDFTEIIYGLNWDSYLFYAAKYHQVAWVILTNGLEFKVLNFGENADPEKYFKCELDAIIMKDQSDSFFTLYKIFSLINRNGSPTDSEANEKEKLSERHHLRKEFWAQLLTRSKKKTELFNRRSPSIYSDMYINSGKKGISFGYHITSNEGARIQIYIDRGNLKWNKEAFDVLFKNKPEIEKLFGQPLLWDRLDNNRASIIRFHVSDYCLEDKNNWPELQDQMIDSMVRLEKAFHNHIKSLN